MVAARGTDLRRGNVRELVAMAPEHSDRRHVDASPRGQPEPVRLSTQARVREWAGTMKRDIFALYLAARDPRVPWYVKGLAAVTVAYALSPIDLIPDFIPVLGYLDDVIIPFRSPLR